MVKVKWHKGAGVKLCGEDGVVNLINGEVNKAKNKAYNNCISGSVYGARAFKDRKKMARGFCGTRNFLAMLSEKKKGTLKNIF